MESKTEKVLGLVFTYPLSLKDWIDSGIFDREKQIYEEHLRQGHFERIIWFTFGEDDSRIRDSLVETGRLDSRIEVIDAPRWSRGKLGLKVYAAILPYYRQKECQTLLLIKSNQMPGAGIAASIAKRYKILFEFRTGYTYSLFHQKRLYEYNGYWKKRKLEFWLKYYKHKEKKLYDECDIAAVSSREDIKYVIDEYGISPKKIYLLTNYIDCKLFGVFSDFSERSDRLLFVGRLSKQKNLSNLIMALADRHVGIDIYGDGEERESLIALAGRLDADVCFKGKVDNDKLPGIYNKYKFYILPSLYEGMPKTLLEAMACGCVCMGTDVEGIREVITNGDNGFLIEGIGADVIKSKILEVITKPKELERISRTAEEYICEQHSLKIVANKEWERINNNVFF